MSGCEESSHYPHVSTEEAIEFGSSWKQAPLSASVINPVMDPLRYNPNSKALFGQEMPLIEKNSTNDNTMMEVDFLDTLGSDLTVPAQFNWVCYDNFNSY